MVDQVALLGVPSSAGTHGPGQEKAPAALRAAGLVQRLEAAGVEVIDHGDLPVTIFQADPAHRVHQGIDQVTSVAKAVSTALLPLLDSTALPILLGGDCTITIGAMAAMVTRWPRAGLLYFDGDVDLSTPETTVSGILDTMVLAHILGEGIPELRDLGPVTPLLPSERVVSFGHEPREVSDPGRALLAHYNLRTHPCTEVTAGDPAACAARAWAELRQHADKVLLHFDVDAIDSTELPLANFPHFNEGLPEQVAMRCLAEFCTSPGLAAMVITEINPDRDPDGSLLDRFATALTTALARH